jgi:adenine/guanine/hypoxanthine permease
MKGKQPLLFAPGDINAFFGLMLDNMSDLVIMAAILTGVFGLPRDLVLGRMLPGSAVGVLVGDLLYSLMAWRLARKTGRDDVTAMPLGLDTPSTFGMAFGVIGPCYLATKDA